MRFIIPLRCILNDVMAREVWFWIEVAQTVAKARGRLLITNFLPHGHSREPVRLFYHRGRSRLKRVWVAWIDAAAARPTRFAILHP